MSRQAQNLLTHGLDTTGGFNAGKYADGKYPISIKYCQFIYRKMEREITIMTYFFFV